MAHSLLLLTSLSSPPQASASQAPHCHGLLAYMPASARPPCPRRSAHIAHAPAIGFSGGGPGSCTMLLTHAANNPAHHPTTGCSGRGARCAAAPDPGAAAAPRARADPRPMLKPREPSGARGAPRLPPAGVRPYVYLYARKDTAHVLKCLTSTWVCPQCMCWHVLPLHPGEGGRLHADSVAMSQAVCDVQACLLGSHARYLLHLTSQWASALLDSHALH